MCHKMMTWFPNFAVQFHGFVVHKPADSWVILSFHVVKKGDFMICARLLRYKWTQDSVQTVKDLILGITLESVSAIGPRWGNVDLWEMAIRVMSKIWLSQIFWKPKIIVLKSKWTSKQIWQFDRSCEQCSLDNSPRLIWIMWAYFHIDIHTLLNFIHYLHPHQR